MNTPLAHAVRVLTENLDLYVRSDDDPAMYNLNQGLRGIAEGIDILEQRIQQLEAIIQNLNTRA